MPLNRIASTVGLALFAWSLSVSVSVAQQKDPEEMAIIKVRICEQQPGEKEPLVLSQPMFQTMLGQPASINVGGTAQSKVDQTEHPIGLRLDVDVKRAASGYAVKLKWLRGQHQQPANDPDTEIFTEEKLTAHTTVKEGKMKKISLSATKWCELTIQDPRKLAQAESDATAQSRAPHWRGYTELPTVSAAPAYPSTRGGHWMLEEKKPPIMQTRPSGN
ncbi:hypothetical protein [Blastopirellula marina]|uniref:Uncharacterized protein n=1 Tax=Blastopirellula marina TaxID=124 RepID=A0A2S8GUQ8_9BACT|nr:hypothetical protein [Blastopirellula marina]PQO48146.1 hypothetical protein C5Y93_00245 [Blastopirellula marina]